MITIAIIEDSSEFAEKIEQFIKPLSDFRILIKTLTAMAFIEFCHSSKILPDIVLTDIEMPGMDGVALTDYLTVYFSSIKVVGISNYSMVGLVSDLISCGAWGYVAKVNYTSSLKECLFKIANKEMFIDPIIDESIDRDTLIEKRQQERLFVSSVGLTAREEQLINLHATNFSQTDIADLLFLSQKTIEKQLKKASDKLHVNDRRSLVVEGIRKGIVKVARFF